MAWSQSTFSSMISDVGYDPDRQMLSVKFAKGGAIWEYGPMDEATAQALANAPSVGSMFLSEIKPQYPARRVG